MDRDDFKALLAIVSDSAVQFAKRYVSQNLPNNYLYHVLLNQSFDTHATPDEVVYPEDDGVELSYLTVGQVVALIYREGKCPEWIDISVEAVNQDFSMLRLLCCGRFTSDASKMYYSSRGHGPFGIKSPDLPPGFCDGQRYTLPAV